MASGTAWRVKTPQFAQTQNFAKSLDPALFWRQSLSFKTKKFRNPKQTSSTNERLHATRRRYFQKLLPNKVANSQQFSTCGHDKKHEQHSFSTQFRPNGKTETRAYNWRYVLPTEFIQLIHLTATYWPTQIYLTESSQNDISLQRTID